MRVVMLAAALLLSASTASAQGRQRIRPMRPPPGASVAPRRQALEKQFRQRAEQVVRDRLNLNDQQVTRLRSVNANVGAQRSELMAQERSIRADLRDEMGKGSAANQDRVAQLMAQAHDLESRRFALQQDEQRQLSDFLTPVQVAQYVGLQAQIRERIRELRTRNGQQGIPNP
jgi:hypothetical protein